MSNQAPHVSGETTETVTKYEALFATRTGLTIMLPCAAVFENSLKTPPRFTVNPDDPRDIIIACGGKKLLLKGLRKEHVAASVVNGFIMFYETKGDEVVRCTSCSYQKN